MNKLLKLPKEKLVEIIEKFYKILIIEPKYNIYSKAFFIEFLKKSYEIYKRYKNFRVSIIMFKFDTFFIKTLKKNLRKSDLIAKYDNAFVVLLPETSWVGVCKVRKKLEALLKVKIVTIEINLSKSFTDILKEIEEKSKIF